jgi:single-strand DNA-binding protein
MSYDINSFTMIGRLTRDPELSYTPQNNTAVCKFSVANNTGKDDSTVGFYNVVVWGKMAEIANQYLEKGSQVVLNGRLQQRRYQGKDGTNKSIVELVANNVQFVGPKKSGQGGNNPPPPANDGFEQGGDNEDIPF